MPDPTISPSQRLGGCSGSEGHDSVGRANDEERKRQEDLNVTSTWLFFALLAGIIVIFLRYFIPFILRVKTGESWNFTGQIASSFLWAFAWFSAAFVIGFLFGIPKTPGEKSASNTSQGSKSP